MNNLLKVAPGRPARHHAAMVQENKLSEIQVLRAVAIVMVLVHHFSLIWTLIEPFPRLTSPFYAGVELFFVISGFVVTRSIFEGSGSTAFQFVIRRVFRLYPAIFFFLAVVAATSIAASFMSADSFAFT